MRDENWSYHRQTEKAEDLWGRNSDKLFLYDCLLNKREPPPPVLLWPVRAEPSSRSEGTLPRATDFFEMLKGCVATRLGRWIFGKPLAEACAELLT